MRTRALRRRGPAIAVCAFAVGLASTIAVWPHEASTASAPALAVEAPEHVGLDVRATAQIDAPPPRPAASPRPRPLHAVLVKTHPIAARVVVDGRSFGTTPTYVKVPAHVPVELHISRPGFQPVVHEMTSKTRTDRVFVRLKPRKR